MAVGRAACRGSESQGDPPGDLLRARRADLRLVRRRDGLLDGERRHLPHLPTARPRRGPGDRHRPGAGAVTQARVRRPRRAGRLLGRASGAALDVAPTRRSSSPRCLAPRCPSQSRVVALDRAARRGRGSRLPFDLPARLGDLACAERPIAWSHRPSRSVRRSRCPAIGSRPSWRSPRAPVATRSKLPGVHAHAGPPARRRPGLGASEHRRQDLELARRPERGGHRHRRRDATAATRRTPASTRRQGVAGDDQAAAAGPRRAASWSSRCRVARRSRRSG